MTYILTTRGIQLRFRSQILVMYIRVRLQIGMKHYPNHTECKSMKTKGKG